MEGEACSTWEEIISILGWSLTALSPCLFYRGKATIVYISNHSKAGHVLHSSWFWQTKCTIWNFINHFASHCFLKTKCSKYLPPSTDLKYLVMKKPNWYFSIVKLSVLVQSSSIKWIPPPNPIIKTLDNHIRYRMTHLSHNFFIYEMKEQNVIINSS